MNSYATHQFSSSFDTKNTKLVIVVYGSSLKEKDWGIYHPRSVINPPNHDVIVRRKHKHEHRRQQRFGFCSILFDLSTD